MFPVRCVFFPLFSLCGELLFSQRCAQSNGVKECDPMREYERSFHSLFSGWLSLLCPGYAPAARRELVHAPRGLNRTRDVSFQRNARATDNDTTGLCTGDRVSREIVSQSRHVESEKPRNVGPREWNQLFFLAQRRNSRRQMTFRKKDETRHNSCRGGDPFRETGKHCSYERLPRILTRLTFAHRVVNPTER